MPKVLVVTEGLGFYNANTVVRTLQNLGIETEMAFARDANVAVGTRIGELGAGSDELRNYFRQFDAVFVFTLREANVNVGVNASVRWLSWNAPEDPPIVYFTPNLSTAVTQIDSLIPSDFPIVRPNPTDISSGISSQTQPSTAVVLDNFAPAYSAFQLFGTAVRLLREQADVLVGSYCWRANTNHIGAWRYDPSKHSTLANQSYTHPVALNGKAGELIAIPATQPDESYPSNTVYAYRYYNRFFLPAAHVSGRSAYPSIAAVRQNYVFWLLYGLKLCGVRPVWQIPLLYETDHPIQCHTRTGLDNLTFAQQLAVWRQMFEYLRGFCQQTGMVVHNGATTGGMSRRRTDTHPTYGSGAGDHWVLTRATQYGQPIEVEQAAQALNNLLIAGHREGTLPCGFHDHTVGGATGRGLWGSREYASFRRHQASDYQGLSFPLEAPNTVKTNHGRCCVARHVAPSGLPADAIETTIGDETIVEWDFAGRESSAMAMGTVSAGNIHIARVVIESNVAELRALGFPDGHGGDHGYTNTAANNSGGPCYWQAAREYGYKALRSSYACNKNADANNQCVPPNRVWRGFHLIYDWGMDAVSSANQHTGLYSGLTTGGASDVVRTYTLDFAGDITANYPDTAWRAHRRAVCRFTSEYLWTFVYQLGTFYIHPTGSWFGVSLTDPTARFDGAYILNPFNFPHWNPTVELLENMRVIVGVLSEYLKFGSISDLIAVRGRATAAW